MTLKNLIFIFLFTFTPQINFAQMDLRLNLEGGYYQATSKSMAESDQKDATARIDGEAGYKYQNNKNIFAVKLRARPEIYGLNNNLKILKLKAACSYYFGGDNLTLGLNLNGQKNNYNGRSINLNYKDLIFMLESLTKLNNNFSLSSNLGYGYQIVSNDVNQQMNLLILDADIIQQVLKNAKIGYGIYSERFFLKNKFQIENSNNRGWRIGPHVSFDYLKSFLVNFDYRFLFHISEVTQSPSYEYWIRLVAGKLITENWSVFVLTDYYFRKYTIENNLKNPYLFLYTPINEDNRIYLKIAYNLSDIIETYFKVGYFRENLYNNYSFAGWNILAGFEFEK